MSTSSTRVWWFTVLIASWLAAPAGAVDVHDTRMLSQPAISAQHIAFVYAGDLWVAGRDGRGVRRLTTHAGEESDPRFSPDGRSLAFSAAYDGNVDVYLMPVAGGVAQRLTWHPSRDLVQGFTLDGTAVLFRSQRTAPVAALDRPAGRRGEPQARAGEAARRGPGPITSPPTIPPPSPAPWCATCGTVRSPSPSSGRFSG